MLVLSPLPKSLTPLVNICISHTTNHFRGKKKKHEQIKVVPELESKLKFPTNPLEKTLKTQKNSQSIHENKLIFALHFGHHPCLSKTITKHVFMH